MAAEQLHGYIVVFNKEATAEEKQAVRDEITASGGAVVADLSIINGISAKFSPSKHGEVSAKPSVKYVQKDGTVHASSKGFIVVFKKEATDAEKAAVRDEIVASGGSIVADLGIINGCSVRFGADQHAHFSAKPCVSYIEADGVASAFETKPYIVVCKKEATDAEKTALRNDIVAAGGTLGAELSIINGFGAHFPEDKHGEFSGRPYVNYIEADGAVHALATKGYIIVFKKDATDAQKAHVRDEVVTHGGSVVAELPIINAVSVTFPEGKHAHFAQKLCVSYIEPEGAVGACATKPYIVVFKKDATDAHKNDVKAQVTAAGGSIGPSLDIINGVSVHLPEHQLPRFMHCDAVHYIEADGTATTCS